MGQLNDDDMFEVTSLVYRRWATAYDTLKAVKEEKPNYKLEPDWDEFHKLRLENATADEAKWKALLNRCTEQCPRIDLESKA